MALNKLIDKYDNFEVVRSQIASILAIETAAQQALATAATKDPKLWKFTVYEERFDPFEKWLKGDPESDKTPIVSVWFDSFTVDKKDSTSGLRTKSVGTFNIDVFGYGENVKTATGHNPADREAALACQRVIRLVRNIIQAKTYRQLGLGNVIWDRWFQSVQAYAPDTNLRPMQRIAGARMKLVVGFNEFTEQATEYIMEEIYAKIVKLEDGEFTLAEALFEATPEE